MIAAELYTLRDHLKDEGSIARSLARVREIGYTAVELAGLGPVEPARLAALLRETALVAASAHVAWERLHWETERVIEDCRTWGCLHVAIPILPDEYRNSAGYARFAADAEAVARRLAGAEIRLSYHNHSFELERFGADSGLEIMRRSSDGGLLGFQPDTYWIQHGGGSPAAWIRRLSGRVPTVHLKDMTVVDGESGMAAVGEGNLDWDEVLAACSKAGVEWLIVEQDHCRGDPFDSLAVSLRNLSGLLVGAGWAQRHPTRLDR